jgi:hypothetical protein
MIKNISHPKQVSETLNIFNLKETQSVRGFDPDRPFSRHLASIKYNNIFTLFDDENPQKSSKKEKNACSDNLLIEIKSNTKG